MEVVLYLEDTRAEVGIEYTWLCRPCLAWSILSDQVTILREGRSHGSKDEAGDGSSYIRALERDVVVTDVLGWLWWIGISWRLMTKSEDRSAT